LLIFFFSQLAFANIKVIIVYFFINFIFFGYLEIYYNFGIS